MNQIARNTWLSLQPVIQRTMNSLRKTLRSLKEISAALTVARNKQSQPWTWPIITWSQEAQDALTYPKIEPLRNNHSLQAMLIQ